MTFDWTISAGNVLTAFGGLVALTTFFFKLHTCLERRLAKVEQQIALVEQSTELRHRENDRRLVEIRDSVGRLA